MEQNYFETNNIFTRRSVRKYKNKPIEKEKVEMLLRAAMQAPTAKNRQEWEFIVVDDKSILNKLAEIDKPGTNPIAEARLAIILLANIKFCSDGAMIYWQQDLAAATQNIMLEAVNQGLGSVWIGMSPKNIRESGVKRIFNIDEDTKVASLISIGYPENENANNYIDRFNPSRIHYNSY